MPEKEDSLPLLSVCIPTYNGGDYLIHNIEVLMEQVLRDKICDVEIVVSDNCSTDGTMEKMRVFCEKYPKIFKYNRNSKNLGYDGNILCLLNMARGRYVHFFGDDDFFLPGGLSRTVNILRGNEEFSIIILGNSFYRDNEKSYVLRENLNCNYSTSDRFFNDCDDFINFVGDRIWPCSDIIFLREGLLGLNLEESFKDDWSHIYMTLALAAKNPRCFVMRDDKPVIANRVSVQKWRNRTDAPRIYYNNIATYAKMLDMGYKQSTFNLYRYWYMSNCISDIKIRRPKGLMKKLWYLKRYKKYYGDTLIFYFSFIFAYIFGFSLISVLPIKPGVFRIRLPFLNFKIRLKS